MVKRMSRYIERDLQMVLDSAITAKKVAYQKYKAILIKWIKTTWIGDDGEMVVLKSNYVEKLNEAEAELIRANIEVEHYRKEVQDAELH